MTTTARGGRDVQSVPKVAARKRHTAGPSHRLAHQLLAGLTILVVPAVNAGDRCTRAADLHTRFALLAATRAPENARITLRDDRGFTVGHASVHGDRIVFRDAVGRRVGTATKWGDQVVLRDEFGRRIGTARVWGDRIVVRDGLGRTTATATVYDGRIVYRDALGRRTGSAVFYNDVVRLRDELGRSCGSARSDARWKP